MDKGAKVTVVTADAEIPAPDGTHELEDGTKVETKDGIIVDVTDVPNETPADEENEIPEGKDVEAPQGMSSEMFDMLKEFISKMGEKMSAMEQSYSNLENEFNAFKKQPAGKKIADGKTEVFTKTNNEDILEAKLAAIKSLRNK